MTTALLDFTLPFFWDTDVTKIDAFKDYYIVIERLIEYGNDPAIKWMMATYPKEQIQEVVKTSRKISGKTASLWQNYYDLPREVVRCLNKQFQKTDGIFWNY